MELGGGGKEILVRGMKGIDGSVSDYDEYVFYKIDIERQDSGLVSTTCCPSLFNQMGNVSGIMFKLGSSIIYIIGDKTYRNPKSKSEAQVPSPNLIDGCWIDLSEINPKWRSAPCPTHNTWCPICVPLSGKIYSFGLSTFKLEVYNHPNDKDVECGGCWVELPPPPSEISDASSYVSFYPIPDPDYDRIIVHIKSTIYGRNPNNDIQSAIYAFKPNNDNKWERLSPPDDGFLFWDKRSAIVDGVVYIAHGGHIQCIGAYDLGDSVHGLKVEWSNSTYPEHMEGIEFDDLLNLGNGFLCLAVYTPLDPPPHATRVYFVLLSFKRQTHDDVVTFTYHYFRYYDLTPTSSVLDFIALGE